MKQACPITSFVCHEASLSYETCPIEMFMCHEASLSFKKGHISICPIEKCPIKLCPTNICPLDSEAGEGGAGEGEGDVRGEVKVENTEPHPRGEEERYA
jgi:hypothetical protein